MSKGIRGRLAVAAAIALWLAGSPLWPAQSDPPELRRVATSDVRELRLGVVCYGGVSLAVYMHGVTKEIQRLVVASRAFEDASGHPEQGNPFPEHRTEHQYFEVLRELALEEDVRTQVIVDTIAGTSAGGINGIVLAKTLALNRGQETFRDLWLERAGLSKLLGWGGLRVPFALLPGTRLHLLRGQAMLRWLVEAIDELDDPEKNPPAWAGAGGSLVPPKTRLDLFVTTTDLQGALRSVPLTRPRQLRERQHARVMRFEYLDREDGERDRNHFTAEHNLALAFAARATSSIPGAFRPLHIEDVRQAAQSVRGVPPEVLERQMQNVRDLFYSDVGDPREAERTFFVDGGILDNHPFGPVIGAVADKSMIGREVDRRILFIEPDPKLLADPQAKGAGKRPGLYGSIISGFLGARGGDPILADVREVQEINETRVRIGDLIADSEPLISDSLESEVVLDSVARVAGVDRWAIGRADELAADLGIDSLKIAQLLELLEARLAIEIDDARATELRTVEDLLEEIAGEGDRYLFWLDAESAAARRETGEELAKRQAGYLWRAYFSVRVSSVIRHFANALNIQLGHPEDSEKAECVRRVVRAWAVHRGYLGDDPGTGTNLEAQRELVDRYDIDLLRRRLRFVAGAVGELYGAAGAPARADLDRVRALLLGHDADLTGVIHGETPSFAGAELRGRIETLRDRLGELFQGDASPCRVDPDLEANWTEVAEAFVADHGAELDSAAELLAAVLGEVRDEIRRRLLAQFSSETAGWPHEARRRILGRYFGFPFWDALIYPSQSLTDTWEVDDIAVVRISPDDAKTLFDDRRQKVIEGRKAGHAGAFFKRRYRENDYLWGRLDGVDLLVGMLTETGEARSRGLPAAAVRSLRLEGFRSVLAEEDDLGRIDALKGRIEERILCLEGRLPPDCAESDTSD